jgi:hypothetical protein
MRMASSNWAGGGFQSILTLNLIAPCAYSMPATGLKGIKNQDRAKASLLVLRSLVERMRVSLISSCFRISG